MIVAISGKKGIFSGRETDRSAGGAAVLPPFPGGEQTFRVVHACGRAGKDGKRGYRRTGNPFIKALQA